MKTSRIHFLSNDPRIGSRFTSAVSLHGHTLHSHESLTMLPTYARGNPLFGATLGALRRRYREMTGTELDFAKTYFTPPLSASRAYQLEVRQIQEELGLCAMVSLTDHDTTAAPELLRLFMDHDRIPISIEWTVPHENTYFHLGVHNIHPDTAATLVREMGQVRCSSCVSDNLFCDGRHSWNCGGAVRQVLEKLNSFSDTLVVFNHPLWDTCGLGTANHRRAVINFLNRFKPYIHALEINGLRTWGENCRALNLAADWGLPVVSGGDRHGCEPNAVLNLTVASSFSDFVMELRQEGMSDLVFMPQYSEPLNLRKLQTAWDVLRDLPNYAGGIDRWVDRVFVPWPGREVAPLSAFWKEGEPRTLKHLLYLVRLGETPRLRPLLRYVL